MKERNQGQVEQRRNMAYFGIFLDTFEYIGGSGSSLNIHAGCVGDVDRIDSFRSIAADFLTSSDGSGIEKELLSIYNKQHPKTP
ncbi:hypothetical protein DERP_005898 [Dermatophagoides pteronyssinus]|uniref:Uncharacterized protein n=1 Tax=Dermatophagoides pteronyssinus TaxID=6956 RepID=A0ABQ8JS84_DERPT|nr:hypothetical protein DERP_005898 [Dermatophagoides pteronyssinus]